VQSWFTPVGNHLRRETVRKLAIVLLLSAGFVSLATPAAAVSPGGDFAVGFGERLTLAGFPAKIFVFASSGPTGEGAHGYFTSSVDVPSGTQSISGRITCLTVAGNRAAARGIVEVSNGPANPVGSTFQIQVTDNGLSGDTNINLFGFEPGETGCPLIDFPEVPIRFGDFVVRDA
jgi:hypothetical protein